MENLYQIPPRGSCSLEERTFFWQKIIAEQIASGMKMTKFCRQHQLSVSALKRWKRNLQSGKEHVTVSATTRQKIKAAATEISFIPLQVTQNNLAQKEKGQMEVNIRFKNGHSIIVSAADIHKIMPLVIEQVSELPC